MIFTEKDFAVFDELELFNQFVYQGPSEEMKSSHPKPRNEFYQIWTPFYMDSQLKKLTNEEGMDTNTTNKGKRKGSFANGRESDTNSFLFSNCRLVQSTFGKFQSSYKNFIKSDANNPRDNETARNCVKMAPLFHSTAVSTIGGFDGLLEAVQLYQADESVHSPCLPSEVLATTSTGRNEAASILYSNPRNWPISLDSWVFPAKSSFLLGDVALTRHFLSQKFDLIVADPPWRNRTVKRQRTYQMFNRCGKFFADTSLDSLGLLQIPQLLVDGSLFCIWLSNSQTAHNVAQRLLEKWKMRRLAQWHWLKICKTGEPICAFRPEHKVPFESLLIACNDCAANLAKWEHIPDDFCIISVPNANPSRKPPISLLLQQLGFIRPVLNGLELYARYLLPNFTSVGYESTKFQQRYYFHSK